MFLNVVFGMCILFNDSRCAFLCPRRLPRRAPYSTAIHSGDQQHRQVNMYAVLHRFATAAIGMSYLSHDWQ